MSARFKIDAEVGGWEGTVLDPVTVTGASSSSEGFDFGEAVDVGVPLVVWVPAVPLVALDPEAAAVVPVAVPPFAVPLPVFELPDVVPAVEPAGPGFEAGPDAVAGPGSRVIEGPPVPTGVSPVGHTGTKTV